MDERLEFKIIRGLETAWLESGTPGKPILLFLHGYPDGPDVWREQAEYFSNAYHVIRPFNRGVAHSQNSDDILRYGADSSCLDILEILHEIDPDTKQPVYCVGHDLGAVLAWNLADLLRDRLRALVILNGLSVPQMARRFRRLGQHLRSWYIYLMQVPRLPTLLISHFGVPIYSFAYALGGLPIEKRVYPEHTNDFLIGPIKQYRAFAREIPKTLRRKTPRLESPLLVIWGNKDRFLQTPTLKELEPYAHKVTMRILEGGHWVFREKPEEVNEILAHFFGKLGK